MRNVFALCLLTVGSLCFGEWDPDYLLYDLESSEQEAAALHDWDFAAYKKLKAKVLSKSVNKISQEKVELIMDLIVMARPKVCVEIGVGQGGSIVPIAATLRYLKQGKVFAIDAWSADIATRYLDADDPNKPGLLKQNKDKEYKKFLKTLDEWSLEKYCTTIRKTSEKAVGKVDHIDFLHLDGDYSERGSIRDVELYLPKVNKGGYILLSNLFIMINGKQPKLKAFALLFDHCEMVCEIEQDNAILFRKL